MQPYTKQTPDLPTQPLPTPQPPAPRGRQGLRLRPWVIVVIAILLIAIVGAGAFYIYKKTTKPPTNVQVTNPGSHISAVIPAYWGKLPKKWLQLEQAHPAGTIAIANFNAGPPPANDADITKILADAHASGLKVIGYVHTSYGARPIAEVQQEITQWYAYSIDGVFLDEGKSDDTSTLSYYQNVASIIRAEPGSHLIVLNSGSVPGSSSFLQTADIIMTYESSVTRLGRYAAPDWLKDSTRFAAIVEDVTPDQMSNIVQQCVQNYFGYIYITHDNQDYGHLPTYWSQEVAALNKAVTA